MSEILFYTSNNKDIKLEVNLEDETVWLSQKQMAMLFDVTYENIRQHIFNIYKSEELLESSTSKKFLEVRKEGNREVKRQIPYYNLDVIIAVGYRVNSVRATHFRQWATKTLKEFIIKGFVLDDERLKNGQAFGKDYFDELLERVRSIRASERRIYQKLTDIFAECSTDYLPTSQVTKDFYASVQNKFHFAITGKTGAEIIHDKADSSKPKMGLQTWKNSPKGRIIKSDTTTAKNYLKVKEIKSLERAVASFFDYIEGLIERRTTFTMEDFASSINKFLEFNEYKILNSKGQISAKQAEDKAHEEYEKFKTIQDKELKSDFDKLVEKTKKKGEKE